MNKYKAPLLFAILAIPVITACHPEGRYKLELNPCNLGSKISDIHVAATKSIMKNIIEQTDCDERG